MVNQKLHQKVHDREENDALQSKSKNAAETRWGHLPINQEVPQIMHIDLNSAFATIEQQARPSLRGRPVGVTNRISKNCCVIAASYEAKQLGIKVGMGLIEARAMVPDLVMLESDPPKYHFVYKKLCSIMKNYSPNVKMKSIDEGVIDFHGTLGTVNKKPLRDIGMEIKQRLRSEVGNWMKINVGIGPNRFLAKTASNLNKPDGLDEIDHRNLKDVYASLKLTDLSGIARHYEARLNSVGIFTPMDFLNASADTLKRLVFHSVSGDDWYQRLRGYEVDDEPTRLGQVGRQFVLDKRTSENSFILPRFQYLCETTATKLRYNNVDARGVLVWLVLASGEYWQVRKMFKSTFYTDREVYSRALYLFNQRPKVPVTTIGITCYKLTPTKRSQSSLFEEVNKQEWLTQAVDEINERFGIFTVHSLNSLEGKTIVRQKIPAFGGSQYFELLLKRA
jgi:DNA polymerase-4